MNQQELDALVESKLAERLAAREAAERAQMRTEVILALRREASRAHLDKVNAKAPIEGPLSKMTRAKTILDQRLCQGFPCPRVLRIYPGCRVRFSALLCSRVQN
jgi:hypothetical protein